MRTNKAIIVASLAAGSTATPYYFNVTARQQLNSPTCVSQIPVFAPQIQLVSYSAVGTGQYEAVVNIQGIISYNQSCDCGCADVEVVNQNFVIPFYSADAPSAVTVSAGTISNSLIRNGCKNMTRQFVCEFPLTLTVTAA